MRNSLRRKNKSTVIHKIGRLDNIDSAFIISGISKAVQNRKFVLLMTTADSMLSNRSVLRITVTLFFLLKLFSSRICCNPKIRTVCHFMLNDFQFVSF